METTKYIAYFRVSTKKQSLGLDAQRETVNNWIKNNSGEVIAEYSEKESGKIDARPELEKALEQCKESGATLLIAKLDRLSRDVAFIFTLQKQGAKFQACDLPEFNTLTLAIFAGLAQQERELISSRTKAALAERYKSRTWKESHPNNNVSEKAREISLEIRRSAARQNKANRQAFAAIKLGVDAGISLAQLTRYLNTNDFKTAKGRIWRSTQVKRLINLYANE